MHQEVDSETRITKNEETYSPAIAGQVAAAEAWLKAACAMAKKFPRDIDMVRDNILRECRRPDFARGRYNEKTKKWEGGARYAKPVGGGNVTGFSVRFAEAAVQALGHIHTTNETLAENEDFRKIQVRVWDAQTMNSFADEATIPKTIERKFVPKERMGDVVRTRHNASGEILYVLRAEEPDMLNIANSGKSKSFRNSALRCIPGWLLAECEQVIKETVTKEDSKDPDATKRQIFDSFSGLGVNAETLKKYLGHDAAVLQPEELANLRDLYTAIRDGETTIQAVFAQREEAAKEKGENGKGMAGLKDKLKPTDRELNKSEVQSLLGASERSGWRAIDFSRAVDKKFFCGIDELKVSQLEEALNLANGGA